jgi:energy-coupling factor transporter transmembrane protein EcfT
MDIFEFIALIILLAAFLILFGIYYVLPVYIAYRKGKNWKKYILPTVIFGPFVIPFALYQGKDANTVNTAGSSHSSSDQPGTSDVSALEPGEVVTLKLSAKKAGNKGVLTFTDKKIVRKKCEIETDKLITWILDKDTNYGIIKNKLKKSQTV